MSKKISQMTPTGVAPATSELAIAYGGDNYKINPADFVNSVAAPGASIPTLFSCAGGTTAGANVTGIKVVKLDGGYAEYHFLQDNGQYFGFTANQKYGAGPCST